MLKVKSGFGSPIKHSVWWKYNFQIPLLKLANSNLKKTLIKTENPDQITDPILIIKTWQFQSKDVYFSQIDFHWYIQDNKPYYFEQAIII